MLIERALERVAPVNGHPGGDAEIGQTAAPDNERQGILQRLKPPQKPVPFDRYTRADCRGPRLLQIGNDTLQLYGAALVPTADPPRRGRGRRRPRYVADAHRAAERNPARP